MAVVGRIARTHGLRGEVIVNVETDFPAERPHHLADDIEEDAELPFDESPRYRGSGGNAVAEPIGPLEDHLVPQFGDDTASSEQRGLRSTHETVLPDKGCGNLTVER